MAVARRESVVFTVIVSVLVAIGAVPMIFVIALSGAPSTLLLATILAAVPVVPLVACYLWLDRYEPEPRRLLWSGLAWGGFAATAIALLLQGIGGYLGGLSTQQSLAIAAPVTEEATKGLYLLLLLWWRRHEVDGVLDGVVYAGMVGIGFAFTENILYLAAAYNGTDGMGPGGVAAVGAVFVMRCLFSPFAHPLFTSFIGVGVGVAITTRNPAVRTVAPIAGYCLAVLTHGVWNASTIGGTQGFLGAYVIVMVPAFFLMVGFAIWSRRGEQRLLGAALQDAAGRGLLPAGDVPWLVSLQARRVARKVARERQGAAGESAMRDYQEAAIELGFLHHRYLRGTAPADAAARANEFIGRMHTARRSVTFPYEGTAYHASPGGPGGPPDPGPRPGQAVHPQ